MTQRSNLQEIHVPVPATDEIYTIVLLDRDYTFHGLKQLLGAADVSKAGDRSTGLCAENEIARQAARSILSSLTLQHLYDRPLVDDEGRTDSIMRVNYDLNLKTFQDIASKSLGQLKDHLLNSSPEEIKRVGRGLTGVMVAAIVKLLDVHEMIYLSKQIRQPTKARTQIGLSGTL